MPLHDHEILENDAHNQSLFRAVNERVRELNELFAPLTGTYSINCECSDLSCVDRLEIPPDEYMRVRLSGAFIVLPGHADPSRHAVIERFPRFAVVGWDQSRAA
jgi:hypothetical protein